MLFMIYPPKVFPDTLKAINAGFSHYHLLLNLQPISRRYMLNVFSRGQAL
jgi:hypothetical protein